MENKEISSTDKLPWQRFLIPLSIQTILILAVPVSGLITSIIGETVILKTQPVDPYDLVRGYSQLLRYDISSTDELATLTGWEELQKQVNSRSKTEPKTKVTNNPQWLNTKTKLYVVLEAPKRQQNNPPLPWQPIAVSLDYPQNITENQIVIRGVAKNTSVIYGLETYYFPEAKRKEINSQISQIQRGRQRSFVVETKIDRRGNAVPVSLWLGKRNYKF